MKKKLLLYVILICCLFYKIDVNASTLTCSYKVPQPEFTFQCSYSYGNKVKCVSTWKNSNRHLSGASLGTSDFVDGKTGKVSCPILKIKSQAYAKQKWKYTITVDPTGTQGVESNRVDDDKEKNDANDPNNSDGQNHTKVCEYAIGAEALDDKIGLSWTNGKLKTEIVSGLLGYKIDVKGNFTESLFANGKCPEVHTQRVSKAQKVIVSTDVILMEDEKVNESTGADDISTGENEARPPQSNNNTNQGNTTNNDSNNDKDQSEVEHIGENFCDEKGVVNSLKMIGAFLTIAKLAVPLLIVVLGIIDLAKGILGGNQDKVSAGVKSLIYRIIIGILIFFLPVILRAILNGLLPEEYEKCSNCLFYATNDCSPK